MRGKIIVLFALCVLLLSTASCNVREKTGYALPKFAVQEESCFEILGEELFGINATTDLIPYKEWLIVVAYNAVNKECLHVFDKEGKAVKSAVKIGRGPGELLFPVNTSFDRDKGILTFFDNIGKKTLEIDIREWVESGQIEEAILNEYRELGYPTLSRLTPKGRMDFNGVLPLGKDNHQRFIYVDYSTNDTLTFNSYPASLSNDPWALFYLYDANTMMEMSPNGNKMVVCSNWCGILETFSIESEIEPISISYFIEPKYQGDKNGGGMELTDETVFAFSDIYVTDSLLFCGYDGESTQEADRGTWFTKVAVFDWEGNPLKVIKTDKRIEQIAIDDDGRIFALISTRSGEVYLAMLPVYRTRDKAVPCLFVQKK